MKVKRYELEGGILYLDFNAKYKQMDTVEETLVRAALVKSLVRIEGINSVWIKVEGADLTDSSGQVLGYLNEDDFVQSEGASPIEVIRQVLGAIVGSVTKVVTGAAGLVGDGAQAVGDRLAE